MALLERLQILIDADAKGAQKEFEGIGRAAERELGKAERSIDRTANKLKSIGTTAAIGGAAVVGGFALLARAADQADREVMRLENSIKNSDRAFKNNGEELVKLAEALQQKTAADADAIVGSQSLLVGFGATEAQIKTLTPLVVDLSRKFGIDLEQAAKAVGRGLDGQGTALKRLGIDIDDARIKTDAYGAVVDGLRGSVAGFAQQEGRTFTGQLERLRNNLGDLAESVGGGAAGVLGGLTQGAANAAQSLNELNPGILTAVGGIGATAGIVATLGGGFAFAGGQVASFLAQTKRSDTALTKLGEDGSRSLTKVGKAAAGIAIVGAVAGVVETVATTFNAINDIDRKLTSAFDGVRKALKGTDAEAANAFKTLLKVEDQTARFSGIWEGFGNEFRLGNISGDVEEFNRAFDNVLDNLGPEAAQKVVDGLRSQNSELDRNSRQYKVNADILGEAEKRTKDRAEALKVATVAERDQEAALKASISQYDRQNATLQGAQNELKAFGDRLKLLRLDYDANTQAAKAFADGIERSTIADDQVGAAISFNEALNKGKETLDALPRSLDPVAIALTGVGDASTDAGEQAVASFLAIGEQAKGLLSTFIQNGDPEGARRLADTLRFQIANELLARGFTQDEVAGYLNLLGLQPFQIDAAINVANVEEELLRVQTVLQVFSDEFDSAPIEVKVGVVQATLDNDLATASTLLRAWLDATNGDPSTKVTIDQVLGANPSLAPVLADLQKQADANGIEIPVKPKPMAEWSLFGINFAGANRRATPGRLGFTAPQAPAPAFGGPSLQQPLGRRAMGGPVFPDGSFLVGERGPELFVPGSMGRIIPNNELRPTSAAATPETAFLRAEVARLADAVSAMSPGINVTVNNPDARPAATDLIDAAKLAKALVG